jgi:hypothetical protein
MDKGCMSVGGWSWSWSSSCGRQSIDQFVGVSGLPLGPLARFYLALLSLSDNYFILLSKVPSLTRKRVCSLQCNHSLVPITILYRLIWDCVPFLSSLTTRRDYGGGILTRLHMGRLLWILWNMNKIELNWIELNENGWRYLSLRESQEKCSLILKCFMAVHRCVFCKQIDQFSGSIVVDNLLSQKVHSWNVSVSLGREWSNLMEIWWNLWGGICPPISPNTSMNILFSRCSTYKPFACIWRHAVFISCKMSVGQTVPVLETQNGCVVLSFQTRRWRGTRWWPSAIPNWKITAVRNTDWSFKWVSVANTRVLQQIQRICIPTLTSAKRYLLAGLSN